MGSAVSCSSPSKSQVVNHSQQPPVKMEESTENSTPSTALVAKTAGKNDESLNTVSEKELAGIGKDGDDLEKDKGTEKEGSKEPKEEIKEKEKKEPMTQEELKEFKEKTYGYLRSTVNEIMALDSFKNEEGDYHVKIRNSCIRFLQSYFALKRTTLEEIIKYRKEVASLMMETKYMDLMCEIIMNTYKGGWRDEDGKNNDKKWAPLGNCMVTVLNFSDASDEFAIALASKPGFIELLKQILLDSKERYLDNVEPKLKDSEEKMMKHSLSIIHNMSMRETNVKRLRDCDLIAVLKPYLKSPNEMYSLNVLASLSGIINEEESEIINSNKDIVLFLLDILRKAMKNELRRHRGWSSKESGFTVRLLARNDANKKLLVDLGALELLVELGRTGSLEEQHESVQAIWALAFDEDNAALITGKADLGVVDLLVDLKQIDNDGIRKACNGALWTLRDALKKTVVEKYKEIGEKLSTQAQRHKSSVAEKKKKISTTGHIMISYQWADQKVLKNVRDSIKAHGYKVWMDIDQMGGSTLQAMADAVEGADVFLMAMSNKYKNSPACRAEAEYAYQLRKKIIPLKMERGYTPDGWLGFILGAKLFFEFSEKYPFEQKMPALLKEIDNVLMPQWGGDAGGHQPEEEITPEKTVVTHAAGPIAVDYPDSSSAPNSVTVSRISVSIATITKVRKWTKIEVKDWIEMNDIKGCGLDNLTGGEVALLLNMRVESPDYFYKCIEDKLKVKDLLTLSKLYWALQDLS